MRLGRQARRVVTVGMAFVLVAGCGEPGPVSRFVALARSSHGLEILYLGCRDDSTSEVLLGRGTDRWASPSIRLVADEPVTGPWRLDMGDVSASGFAVVQGADDLEHLGAPFFVRVYTSAGLDTISFSEEPSTGQALVHDETSDRDDGMTHVPIDTVPESSELCDR